MYSIMRGAFSRYSMLFGPNVTICSECSTVSGGMDFPKSMDEP